jgi:hypothetical protein
MAAIMRVHHSGCYKFDVGLGLAVTGVMITSVVLCRACGVVLKQMRAQGIVVVLLGIGQQLAFLQLMKMELVPTDLSNAVTGSTVIEG